MYSSFQTIFFLAAIAMAYAQPINVVQTHGPLTVSHQPYTISHAPVAVAHAPVAYAHAPVATYSHAAPAVALHSAPVFHAAPAVAAVHAAKVEDYDPHPQYSYAYDIKVSSV